VPFQAIAGHFKPLQASPS